MNPIEDLKKEVKSLEQSIDKIKRNQLNRYRKETLLDRRNRLDIEVLDKFNGIIQKGPFSGSKIFKDTALSGKLTSGTGWGFNYASKIFGFYELQILNYLEKSYFPIFINLGCADGYYLAGMLKSKLSKFAYGFEQNSLVREMAVKTLKLNKLNKFATNIYGEVSHTNFIEFLKGTIESQINLESRTVQSGSPHPLPPGVFKDWCYVT